MSNSSKKAARFAPVVALALLLVAWLVVKQFAGQRVSPKTPPKKETAKPETANRGLNRFPDTIKYSKHAQCRMDCRHISEQEVEEILLNGKINYAKSDIGNLPECRRKYALEGQTGDGQKVRIIFAPCQKNVMVVTVIDLGKDWECDCN